MLHSANDLTTARACKIALAELITEFARLWPRVLRSDPQFANELAARAHRMQALADSLGQVLAASDPCEALGRSVAAIETLREIVARLTTRAAELDEKGIN